MRTLRWMTAILVAAVTAAAATVPAAAAVTGTASAVRRASIDEAAFLVIANPERANHNRAQFTVPACIAPTPPRSRPRPSRCSLSPATSAGCGTRPH